jgi:Flp pilus assembly pilin Flp
LLRELIRDASGASAAEYALIVALIGAPIVLASMAFGPPVRTVMGVRTIGPDGVEHVCVSGSCSPVVADYCEAVFETKVIPANPPPVFVPALGSDAECDGSTPVH